MIRFPKSLDQTTGARVATAAIFLALIRCLAEVFRLQHSAPEPLSVSQVQPFLIGALVAAVALFGMNLLTIYGRHRAVIGLAGLTIGALLLVKFWLIA